MTARKPHPPALPEGCPALLTVAETARLNRVDPKTLTRWAKAGKVDWTWNASRGSRLYPAAQFAELLAVTGWPV